MPKLTRWAAVLAFIVVLAGCQELADPLPVAFSRADDGALVAQVPLCAGDVLLDASVGAKFGDTYRRSGNGDPERAIDQDSILILDLSADAVASGSLTDVFPPLEGPGVEAGTPVPGVLSFGVDTADRSAFVTLDKIDPVPGHAVVVMGEVTRANAGTTLRTLTVAEAESVISSWCSTGRYDD